MGSSGTCMSRSCWSGPSDVSQAQSEGGRSSRSPPWKSSGVKSGSLEMCLARYLLMGVVPVMMKGPRTWIEDVLVHGGRRGIKVVDGTELARVDLAEEVRAGVGVLEDGAKPRGKRKVR
eukprot:scaffold5536_cov186-Amphora_coffeaeformis.AAC.4